MLTTAGKTIACELCGASQSKRKTLSLDELGIGKGRACRTHDEVNAAIEKLRDARVNNLRIETENDAMRSVQDTMLFLAWVTGIRMYNAIHGMPLVILFDRARRALSPALYQRVIDEVVAQGQVTPDELSDSLLTAVWLRKNNKLSDGDNFNSNG